MQYDRVQGSEKVTRHEFDILDPECSAKKRRQFSCDSMEFKESSMPQNEYMQLMSQIASMVEEVRDFDQANGVKDSLNNQ